jgi:GAF domain-containing protein
MGSSTSHHSLEEIIVNEEQDKLSIYKDIAEYIVEEVNQMTGADINLWMLNHDKSVDGQYLKIVASRGKFNEKYLKEARLPISPGSSITALAFKEGEPKIRKDIKDESVKPAFYNLEEARKHGWRSFMALPLIGLGDVRIGSFNLYSKEYDKFNENDVKVMQIFARPAAIALQQREQSRVLRKLTEVSEVLTQQVAQGMDKLLKKIADETRQLFNADCAAIYCYAPNANYCENIEFCDAKKDTDELDQVGRCMLFPDIAERQSDGKCPAKLENDESLLLEKCPAAFIRKVEEIIVHNIDNGEVEISGKNEDKSYPDRESAIRILLNTTMINQVDVKAFVGLSLRTGSSGLNNGSQEVGILFVFFRTSHYFSRDDLQIIRIYAQQIANTILSTRLYEKAQKQAKELVALHETALKIVAQETLGKLLQTIVEESTQLLSAKGGMVFLRVPGQDKVKLWAQKGVIPGTLNIGDVLSFGEGMAGRVMQSRQSLIVDDYSKWEHRIDQLADKAFAVIEVPLPLEGEPIGVINVFDVKGRKFTQEGDLPILERLAQQAALAIHNSRLLEQERTLRSQAEALKEISVAIGSVVGLTDSAETILENLSGVVDFQKAGIQIFRGDSRELLAHRGFEKCEVEENILPPVSREQTVKIKAADKPVVLSKISMDKQGLFPRGSDAADNVKSYVGLPLIYKDKTIGFLTMEHDQPGFYDRKINDVLIPFSGQAANTIGNAKLLDDA